MPNASIEPHLFVILGVTGDLTRRKLLPAVYHLTAQGILIDPCLTIGVARKADLDVMKGNQTIFVHEAEVETSWLRGDTDGKSREP